MVTCNKNSRGYIVCGGVMGTIIVICAWIFVQQWMPTHSSPTLAFRPLPPKEAAGSTLIWLNGTQPENYKFWTDSLDDFLSVYKTPGLVPGRGQNIYNCDYNQPPPKGQVCDVYIKPWAPCVQENNYSYHKGSPCVFLEFDKVVGWIPEYYNNSQNLPDNMPPSLKDYITNLERNENQKLNTIWVSCEGENPADVENIGPLSYIPQPGFPGYYFPYENSEGYLSPLVAVHFERPTRGVLINIECKLWARNIVPDRKEHIGTVHFELLID